jgi:Na+/proline symporter
LLVWLLMAGEVYTTFAFLGASGWVYSPGGPTLYIIAYLTLGEIVLLIMNAISLCQGLKLRPRDIEVWYEDRQDTTFLR